jgi:signal transduction histidine kinase/ActR/RegA family two-component response regulator
MQDRAADHDRLTQGVSFEGRIAGASMATAVAVLLAACLIFSLTQWQAEARLSHQSRAALAQVIAAEAAPALARGDLQDVRITLQSAARVEGVRRVVVLDRDGNQMLEVSSSRLTSEEAGLAKGSAPIADQSRVDGRTLGTLVLTATTTTTPDLLSRYGAAFGALFFIAAGLALFLARWVARRAVAPVVRLSAVMGEVANSADFTQRVAESGDDEFGRLGRSFNALLQRLDINQRDLRRTLVQLTQAKEAAEAANALKSQFLANMSHEIRTPLNGVVTMADIMAGGELIPSQRRKLEVVRTSGAALLAVLNDLLDLSKIEAGRLELQIEPHDLAALLHEVQAIYTPLAGDKGLALSLRSDPNLVGLWRIDAPRLRQILSNLLANAVKFTPQGSVQIDVHLEEPHPGDGLMTLSVTDTGIGIPVHKQGTLFEKFVQVDGSTTRQFGGSGLGLAICRELLQLMGGRIRLESVEGQGSRFTVTLPLMRGADLLNPPLPGPDQAPPLMERQASGRRIKVLAAEDVSANQRVLRAALEDLDVDLTLVTDGNEAIEAWRTHQFDLILMDIQMPNLDGVEATRLIRAEERADGRPYTPIIALSANVMGHQIQSYRAAGCDDHLSKPIELSRLYAAIARWSQLPATDHSSAIAARPLLRKT